MNVPLVDLAPQYMPLKDEIDGAIGEVVSTMQFILGPAVKRFEEAAAAYIGVKHAIGCGSGSDALYLALAALGVGPGDEVITVPHTYVATPEAINRIGARIVFCDIDPETWNMDPAKLGEAITDATKAILPVHIFGQCVDMQAINEVAGEIPVIEDAAQAWGAEHHGKKAGALGTVGCFSFFPTKTLGCFGDGGMLSTDDDDLAAKLRVLRVHGASDDKYLSSSRGINSRLDSMQAAVLGVKLKYVDQWNIERAEIAAYYQQRLADSPAKFSRLAEGNSHVWHQCCIEVPRRDELSAHLKEKNVGSKVYYPVPQHLQDCFASLGYREGDFPLSEALSKVIIALPCWPGMSTEQREYAADCVCGFYS